MKLLKISVIIIAAVLLSACDGTGELSALSLEETMQAGAGDVKYKDNKAEGGSRTEKVTDPGTKEESEKDRPGEGSPDIPEKELPEDDNGSENGKTETADQSGSAEGQAEKKKTAAPASGESVPEKKNENTSRTDPGTSIGTSGRTDPGKNDPEPEKKETPSGNGSTKKSDTHTHSWEPVTKTIHHDAVTEQVWTVDRKAWDETVQKAVPVYKEILICVASCRGCGATFTSEDIDTALTNCHDHIIKVHDNACGYGTEQSYKEMRQTGTEYVNETVHHPEEGHYETVVKQKAWDETVITGYRRLFVLRGPSGISSCAGE